MPSPGPAGAEPAASRPEQRDAAAARPNAPATPKRLDTATEEDLRRALAWAGEIGLGGQTQAVVNAYGAGIQNDVALFGAAHLTDATPLLQTLPELHSLPMRFGASCQLPAREAGNLEVLSRKLRLHLERLAAPGPDGRRPGPGPLREALRAERRGNKPEWLRPEAVPALAQILMGEEAPLRRLLVELLAEVPGRQAAEALARRAAFDLDPGVREAAVAALRGRPAEEYRTVLLKALRYPWAPPAEHAAEALVALGDRGAVPALVTLLPLPDPAGPLPVGKRRLVVQELVRTNHLANCLLCHPPSATAHEPALGVDPVATVSVQDQSLAARIAAVTSASGGYNYAGRQVDTSAARALATVQVPAMIRGDITFLRQDFSVPLPDPVAAAGQALQPPALPGALVRGPAARPATLRYDFVLRTRVVSRKELALLQTIAPERADYPQREAVLFALRGLSGQDVGSTTEAWQDLFPRAEAQVRGARLTRDLLRADPLRRELLLKHYRDTKGAAYTHALAGAVAGLKGAEKEKARELLAERLTRMTADTLRDKLADDDAEVRHAAVAACARKGDRSLVPDLIALLDGPEPLTARLAEESLDELTGQHFPHPAAWKAWWRKHGAAAAEGPAAGG
jgi:HEAT repeat protein